MRISATNALRQPPRAAARWSHDRPSPPLPDFGDELGLYRLVRWAKARARASTRPPAEQAAILAEIEWQYRAALEAEVAERQLGEMPTE